MNKSFQIILVRLIYYIFSIKLTWTTEITTYTCGQKLQSETSRYIRAAPVRMGFGSLTISIRKPGQP